jgi:hypothetical protein
MTHKCWTCEANAPFAVSLCEACEKLLKPAVQRAYASTRDLHEPLAGRIRIAIVMEEVGRRKTTPTPPRPRAPVEARAKVTLTLDDLGL